MNIPNQNQWIRQHNCAEYLRCKNGFFRHAKYLIWINMIWICNKIFGNKICKAKNFKRVVQICPLLLLQRQNHYKKTEINCCLRVMQNISERKSKQEKTNKTNKQLKKETF